jgi:putative lipase involved disintegration of autophagic bodies
MDTSSTLIGIIILILCILPFFFLGRGRKKTEKKMLQSVEDYAMEHNCRVTQIELIRDFVLAIDEINKHVFYYKINKDNTEILDINLTEIKGCKVINIGRNTDNQKITDQLLLSFIPNNAKQKELKLECYNSDVQVQLCGEAQCLERWSEMINTVIGRN